jgi:serine protease
MYVRFGAAPTTSTYDCRPYLVGSNESCNFSGKAGTWYVMVRGYTAFSGVTLTGSYQ